MKTGVYFLFLKRKIVYIGATRCWPKRVGQHLKIEFDEAKFLECPYLDLSRYEARLIGMFRPVHNITGSVKKIRRMKDSWVVENKDYIIQCYKNNDKGSLFLKAERDLGYKYGSGCEYALFTSLKRLFKIEPNGKGGFRQVK